jgi:hypothetical protein
MHDPRCEPFITVKPLPELKTTSWAGQLDAGYLACERALPNNTRL